MWVCKLFPRTQQNIMPLQPKWTELLISIPLRPSLCSKLDEWGDGQGREELGLGCGSIGVGSRGSLDSWWASIY